MGNVRLYGATSGYTELAPPAVAPDGVLSLPTGTGTIAKTTDQGLVHINTTTFSAVSSVSVDDCFTSEYENYLLISRTIHSSTQIELNFRLRVSGSDNSSAAYNQRFLLTSSSGVSTSSSGNQTAGVLNAISANDVGVTVTNVFNPFGAARTQFVGVGNYDNNIRNHNNDHAESSSFDGLTLFVGSGTITGTLRIYGYKNGA